MAMATSRLESSRRAVAQREILLEFYVSTNGHLWKNNTGWNSNADDLPTWYGVEVDDEGYVVKINLPKNNLKGPIPESLGNLSDLMHLNFKYNILSGSIPESLGNLSALTKLYSGVNKFNGTIPQSLGNLSALTHLDLDNNELSGTIPESLGNLFSLTYLDLRINKFSGRIPESLGNLSALTYLDLRRNKFSGNIPESLGNLSALMHLDLDNNELSVFLKEAALRLSSCIHLEYHDSLRNQWVSPPAEVVSRGLEAIVRYYEALERSGSTKSYRLKVVLVGEVCAGKTSLARSILDGLPYLTALEDRTSGVDVHSWKPNGEELLELMMWDFGAHKEYDSMRPFFLSTGALNLVVVDLNKFYHEESEGGKLVYGWLDLLLCRVPGSSVLVVGTHIDCMKGDDEVAYAMKKLDLLIGKHLRVKREEMEKICSKRQGELGAENVEVQPPANLHILGVMAVSCQSGGERMDAVRKKIVELVMHGVRPGTDGTRLFPTVGKVIPMGWARASAVMVALRDGLDPLMAALKPGEVSHAKGEGQTMLPYLHLEDAVVKWKDIWNKGNWDGGAEDAAVTKYLKVTAVIVAAACKTAGGVEIPVSGFVNTFKEELAVEITDRVVTDEVLQEMMGSDGDLEAGVKVCIGKSYEDLREFMNKQEDKLEKRRLEGKVYVDFKDVMILVDDGVGGE